jgi:hypothetical protein
MGGYIAPDEGRVPRDAIAGAFPQPKITAQLTVILYEIDYRFLMKRRWGVRR